MTWLNLINCRSRLNPLTPATVIGFLTLQKYLELYCPGHMYVTAPVIDGRMLKCHLQARHRFSDQMPPLDQARSLLARRDISPMNALRIEKIIDDCNKGDYGVAFPPWSAYCASNATAMLTAPAARWSTLGWTHARLCK